MQVDRYERYWMWAATGMLALFLGASDSRMITAQEFVVDAGWT